jgi:hypothetical protein
LYDTDGRLQPVADADGISPAADTALLLGQIDAGNGRSVDLDDAGFQAWRRLCAEWHAAIYGARANSPDTVLTSFSY